MNNLLGGYWGCAGHATPSASAVEIKRVDIGHQWALVCSARGFLSELKIFSRSVKNPVHRPAVEGIFPIGKKLEMSCFRTANCTERENG
nr:hypothetical protein [[Pseudomonas] sp. BICA1-14]